MKKESRTQQNKESLSISQRPFGRSGVPVSFLGLGGNSLDGVRSQAEAIRIVHEALDVGIKKHDLCSGMTSS